MESRGDQCYLVLAMFIKEWGLGHILAETRKHRMSLMTKYLHTRLAFSP